MYIASGWTVNKNSENLTKDEILDVQLYKKIEDYVKCWEKTIHEINKTYRDKDSVTDVISFALEDDKTFIKTEYRILGDIYICLEKAKSQANE